jgi:hypothetical protein
MTRSLVAVIGALALGSCAHERVLEPAPGATLAAGRSNVAEVTVAGVTVRVSGDAWNGDPWNLYRRYTPVHVTVDNGSHQALSLSLADFGLTTSQGTRFTAVPPGATRGALGLLSGPRPPPIRWARWDGEQFYPTPLDGPRYYDEDIRDDFIERLPTHDMLARALPMGLVPAGGSVSGFLYFQRVADQPPTVQFEMNHGSISLPFQITRR